MNKPPILLVGSGGHARSCIDVIEENMEYSIQGLVGTPDEVGQVVLGYPVLASDKDLGELARDCPNAVVTVGQMESPALRQKLFRMLVELGYRVPTIVSPHAHVSKNAVIHSGTFVMHGAVINARVHIGKNCIINSQALVEHDCRVGDHCHISTGAIVNGGCFIGEGSFLGSRCVLREDINLGIQCVIGMGLTVRHDEPNYTRLVKGT